MLCAHQMVIESQIALDLNPEEMAPHRLGSNPSPRIRGLSNPMRILPLPDPAAYTVVVPQAAEEIDPEREHPVPLRGSRGNDLEVVSGVRVEKKWHDPDKPYNGWYQRALWMHSIALHRFLAKATSLTMQSGQDRRSSEWAAVESDGCVGTVAGVEGAANCFGRFGFEGSPDKSDFLLDSLSGLSLLLTEWVEDL
ncbi:UNVERIFIED_CONTAM: hypothetical protein K2H54_069071 [Gekko kuhli]